MGYLCHILHLLLFLFTKNNRGPGCWCQISGAGPVAPAPPAKASECHYSTGSPPMQAAWHAGDLPKCICTDLWLTLGLRYNMLNVPQNTGINLSESSPARASQLILTHTAVERRRVFKSKRLNPHKYSHIPIHYPSTHTLLPHPPHFLAQPAESSWRQQWSRAALLMSLL
jgi:hypothetical protein